MCGVFYSHQQRELYVSLLQKARTERWGVGRGLFHIVLFQMFSPHLCVYVCVYVCMCVFVCICMHVYMCMYVHVCMYVCMYVYVCVYVYVCLYVFFNLSTLCFLR